MSQYPINLPESKYRAIVRIINKYTDCFVQDRPITGEKGGINGQNTHSGTPTSLGPVDTLVDFNWKTTAPLKHRPFKPKYHLTMGKQIFQVHAQKKSLIDDCSPGENRR